MFMGSPSVVAQVGKDAGGDYARELNSTLFNFGRYAEQRTAALHRYGRG